MYLKTRFALCALAATALTPVLPVWAQETDDAAQNDERRFGPVVVTAQRREQNLIDVPLSVSAFDGDLLAELGVADITEVAKVAPNGGKVMMGKTDASDIGTFAIIADPTGAVCTFMQLKEPQPWDA